MAKQVKHSKYYNRLPRANGLLSALNDAYSLQPSSVSRTPHRSGNNIDVEDYVPEAAIKHDTRLSPTSELTVEQLRGLAANDEIADAIDRITSYLVIVPEFGTSFAYPQFKDSLNLKPEERDSLLAEVTNHWQLVQDNLFSTSASLTLGIHNFIHEWFTLGDVFVAIIRDIKHGKILKLVTQYEPFTEKKYANGEIYYTTLEDNYSIWEAEDMFKLSYHELNPHNRSYVASLRYAYNTYKTIERTRIANAIMAAQFRSVYTVPTKGLGKTKARAKLSSVMGLYKRTIDVNKSSGEVLVNGENSYPINTELWLTETSSGKVDVDNPGDGNPQLNDTEMVEYFFRKFYKQSKLPVSKYEAVNQGYLSGLSELDEDERQFKLMIAKHRSVISKFFSAILWRFLSVTETFIGRKELEDGIIFNFYNEPEHKTDVELLEGIGERLDAINSILDTYKETLEKSNFGETQIAARLNTLRFKLMSKYAPDILEQTTEDYRNVPEQESSDSSDSGYDSDDYGSDDDWDSESGSDDFNDYGDDDWDNEFSDDSGSDWDF